MVIIVCLAIGGYHDIALQTTELIFIALINLARALQLNCSSIQMLY